MNVAKRVDPESSHQKKEKSVTVYGDGYKLTCGDCFTIYTNTESLFCISETNMILYVSIVRVS